MRRIEYFIVLLLLVLLFVLTACQTKSFTITFNTNGGSEIEAITINDVELIDFTEIVTTKEGYTFTGWYMDDALTTLWDADTNLVFQNVTLYAGWNMNSYTVTFETYDGTVVLDQIVPYNTQMIEPDDPSLVGYIFSGWYTNVTMSDPWDFSADTVKGDLTLYAYWVAEDFDAYIETPQQLLGILGSGGSAKYAITADLDFDGIDVTGSGATFSGTLDGLGHTLSNIEAEALNSKEGVFFKYLTGTIKNMVIKDSSYETGGEAGAFMVAHAHGGATFENIEFTNVSMYNPSSYGALLYGDNANDVTGDQPVTISNIIVVNNDDHRIIGQKYTGGLIGYIRNSQTVNINNVYFDSIVTSNTGAYDQVAGSIIGRIAGIESVVTMSQVVIKGSLSASKDVGALVGTSVSGALLSADHIFIDNFDALSGTSSINTFVGNINGMAMQITEAYYVGDRVSLRVGTPDDNVSHFSNQGSNIASADVSSSWYVEAGFGEMFKLETTTLVLNRESGPLVETGVSALEDDVKTTYLIGESLDLDGLVVKKNFSNGTSEALNSSEYFIDFSSFNGNAVGEYSITVIYGEFTDSFVVSVVDVTHITIETMYVDTLYLSGQSLDLSELIVKGILTDGDYIEIASGDYDVDTLFDTNIPDDYDVTITFDVFDSVTFSVSVVNEAISPDNNAVELVVDQSYTGADGVIVTDKPMFKTIKNALIYLDKSNLSDSVLKYMYVKDGTYVEKLNVDIPNVLFIGESELGTVITYDAASGTQKPEGGTWGTQGSATVSLKSTAWGFTAYNLTFANSFDYENSEGINDKQAVAIVVESDMTLFYKVRFTGVQDTLYAKKGRQYYYQCYIEGAVDFIFGNAGPAFFEENLIHVVIRSTNNSGVIATNKGYNDAATVEVQYGYVFYNNVISADAEFPLDSIDLGRPWDQLAKVAYIENKFTDKITTDGWTDMSGNLPENANFYEYGNVDASDNLMPTSTFGKNLTAIEAASYANKDIVFSTTNGEQTFSVVWDYEARLLILTDIENLS